MKITIPLAFQLEELEQQYGLVEIFHNLIGIMNKQPKYQHLIQNLESTRDAIGQTDCKNSGAVAPGKPDRPNKQTQNGE